MRELISNASDAADNCVSSLIAPELYEGDGDLKCGSVFDADKGTLTISDNGIGMTENKRLIILVLLQNLEQRIFDRTWTRSRER
ncbi:hypothetical protein [Canicola haemoglobinophilus]|uniref:hypothetical protein n=1 Tax=Canicola haemoglobinophilus TaxID=733 RepID=UPI001F4496F2|nr:hypothetical protein [Canicola haemoglobinophilus]